MLFAGIYSALIKASVALCFLRGPFCTGASKIRSITGFTSLICTSYTAPVIYNINPISCINFFSSSSCWSWMRVGLPILLGHYIPHILINCLHEWGMILYPIWRRKRYINLFGVHYIFKVISKKPLLVKHVLLVPRNPKMYAKLQNNQKNQDFTYEAFKNTSHFIIKWKFLLFDKKLKTYLKKTAATFSL